MSVVVEVPGHGFPRQAVECDTCGSLILNEGRHEEWHQEQERRLRQIAYHGSDGFERSR